MRNIYLAGPFSWQKRIKEYALYLEQLGYHTTSQWLDQTGSFTTADNKTVQSESTWSECQRLSVRDISNIFEADTLIVFEPGIPLERNTRVAEFGGALFTGRQCIVIGPEDEDKKDVISSIFAKLVTIPEPWLSHPEMSKIKPVMHFRSWEAFLVSLST